MDAVLPAYMLAYLKRATDLTIVVVSQPTMWLLGIKRRTFGGVASAFNL